MKIIRRWTSRISSSFEWMLNQVENHESLVNGAIREIQEAGGRAKAQHRRVKQDGQKMKKHLAELYEAQELWKERAVRSAGLDEKRALECIRRQKRVQREIADLEEQEREHAKMERQLSADLKSIDERLVALKQQKNLLRTRQSRAEALQIVKADDSFLFSEIDDIFDRWEARVTEYEYRGECLVSDYDDFEQDFCTKEEEADLRILLGEVVAEAESAEAGREAGER